MSKIQDTIRLLKAAKRRIRYPSRWVRCLYAVNDDNHRVDPEDVTAVAWCTIGALRNTAYRLKLDYALPDAAIELARTIDAYAADQDNAVQMVQEYNDAPSTGHNDVMPLFDETIERLQQEEKAPC